MAGQSLKVAFEWRIFFNKIYSYLLLSHLSAGARACHQEIFHVDGIERAMASQASFGNGHFIWH